MIRFKYALNGNELELQASNWNGLERVLVNGQQVSRKRNFKPQREHSIQRKGGERCKFEVLIDPQTNELMCRIYKQNQLVTSLKQGKDNLLASQRLLQHSTLFFGLLCLFTLYFN
ncbi:MAG: hypothetical protein ACRDA8_11635 [Shewanella sp.]